MIPWMFSLILRIYLQNTFKCKTVFFLHGAQIYSFTLLNEYFFFLCFIMQVFFLFKKWNTFEWILTFNLSLKSGRKLLFVFSESFKCLWANFQWNNKWSFHWKATFGSWFAAEGVNVLLTKLEMISTCFLFLLLQLLIKVSGFWHTFNFFFVILSDLLEKGFISFFFFNFRPAWYFLNECESVEWSVGDETSLGELLDFWSFSNFLSFAWTSLSDDSFIRFVLLVTKNNLESNRANRIQNLAASL